MGALLLGWASKAVRCAGGGAVPALGAHCCPANPSMATAPKGLHVFLTEQLSVGPQQLSAEEGD